MHRSPSLYHKACPLLLYIPRLLGHPNLCSARRRWITSNYHPPDPTSLYNPRACNLIRGSACPSCRR